MRIEELHIGDIVSIAELGGRKAVVTELSSDGKVCMCRIDDMKEEVYECSKIYLDGYRHELPAFKFDLDAHLFLSVVDDLDIEYRIENKKDELVFRDLDTRCYNWSLSCVIGTKGIAIGNYTAFHHAESEARSHFDKLIRDATEVIPITIKGYQIPRNRAYKLPKWEFMPSSNTLVAEVECGFCRIQYCIDIKCCTLSFYVEAGQGADWKLLCDEIKSIRSAKIEANKHLNKIIKKLISNVTM